jgi:tetratricopeptide (TPR) repeat protein
MSDRIAAIRAMLQKEPGDLFLHYSLAMELSKAGQTDEAFAEFDRCIAIDPDHLPAQVEKAKALRAAGRLGEARELFTSAMELAAMQGQAHVRDYIQQQLESLPK